jgi:uncharacterized membrane protein YGL010W
MKPLEAHMGMYTAYHRNRMNRIIHFVMVPAIVWTLMVALDLVILAQGISLAMPVVGALLIWYFMLDYALGFATTMVYTVLLVMAVWMNAYLNDAQTSLMIAGAVFVGSWIFQFIGHGVWEKRRPALADNLLQVFIAPMFIVAETAFGFGFKKDLEERVEEVAKGHTLDA